MGEGIKRAIKAAKESRKCKKCGKYHWNRGCKVEAK